MRAGVITTVGIVAAVLAGLMPVRPSTAVVPNDPASVNYYQWDSRRAFLSGTSEGVRTDGRGLVISRPSGTVRHTEPGLGTTREYEYARWTSPNYAQGFEATQLIASWNAETPPGTWLEVAARGHTNTGAQTMWYIMGRWASGDGDIQRTSVNGQSDADGDVSVDTFTTAPGVTLHDYQLQVTLYRPSGTAVTPTLRMVGAMTSAIPNRFTVPASRPVGGRGIELPVPRYSQNVHLGQYPQYDGGGEAWCSPTSTEMVVEYWHRKPTAQQMAWVDPSYADPSVDYAARNTYDYSYRGTGNWPFNTAYAAGFGLSGHVTRLRSLDELKRHIRLGIPVITSVSFMAGELNGASYSTPGHLMVVIGFTDDGDVIANDPASPNDAAVRHVYRRAQFEQIWLRTQRHAANGMVASGSGGIAYIITPNGWPVPGVIITTGNAAGRGRIVAANGRSAHG